MALIIYVQLQFSTVVKSTIFTDSFWVKANFFQLYIQLGKFCFPRPTNESDILKLGNDQEKSWKIERYQRYYNGHILGISWFERRTLHEVCSAPQGTEWIIWERGQQKRILTEWVENYYFKLSTWHLYNFSTKTQAKIKLWKQ